MNVFERLFREIRRRSVWQVLGVYLVSGWVVYEVVQSLTEGLGLPTWFPAFAFVVLLVGLPIVLATALVRWDDSGPTSRSEDPSRAKFEGHRGPGDRAAHDVFNWRNVIVAGLAALTLGGIAAGAWLAFGGASMSTGDGVSTTASTPGYATGIERSIAVLPFDNLSADPEQQYFSDGVADQILNALTRIPDLKVTARTSAFAFRDTDLDIRTIADTLGVATVLEGTVQRSGDRVRITAQLIEAESGFHLWSETYDRELIDIFEVQDEVARRIAERLRVELGSADEPRLAGPSTDSPEAHDHYLRGRQLLYRRTDRGIRAAVEAFGRAIEADPAYAPAQAGLALAYGMGALFSVVSGDSSYVWLGRSLAHADRAIELDPETGEAYAARAWARLGPPLQDFEAAERDILRALELQPNVADAHGWHGLLLSRGTRHEEALGAHRRAIDLDPVAPGRRLGFWYSALAARRPELGLEQIRRARQIQPGLVGVATTYEAMTLLLLDRPAECLELEGLSPAYEAMCLHFAGRIDEAEALVASVVEDWRPSSAEAETSGLLQYYAWTGQPEQVLAWLERGFEAAGNLGAVPGGALLVMPPGIWDPVLAEHEARIRSEIDRLGAMVWDRIREEERKAERP